MKQFIERLLSRWFPPASVGAALDATSRNYFDRLARGQLPYRRFDKYVGRVVLGSVKEGPAILIPEQGTRESRALYE